MKLYLIGSENRYSLEQLAMVLFPREKHSFPEDGGQGQAAHDRAVCTVVRSPKSITARTELVSGDKIETGSARALVSNETSQRAYNILEKQTIKRSLYRAAVKLLAQPPPWGALSGVRPAKLARFILESGKTGRQTVSELKSRYFLSAGKARLCAEAAHHAAAVKSTLHPGDISLYIGIPFCPTRCVYCSFISRAVGQSKKLIEPYVEALCEEIRRTAEMMRPLDLRVKTVYIGGGTPTTLSGAQLTRLFQTLRMNFNLETMEEFTVEAGRPDTIDAEKLAAIREGGATRLSINPQTMNDEVLRRIGRAHTAAEVGTAFALARGMGFDCINMDVIAGLPGDSEESFRDTLARVCAFSPENVTVHTMAVKKGSRLRDEPLALPEEELLSRMLSSAEKTLRAASFQPYYLYRQKYMTGSFENIGWSLPGREGIYNICMMEELQTILSFGAGGVTKLVSPDEETIERIINHKYPQEYLRDLDQQIAAKRAVCKFYARFGSSPAECAADIPMERSGFVHSAECE